MIDDSEYSALPDDPELAFVQLERRYREELHAELRDTEVSEIANEAYIQYMTHVLAAAAGLELDILSEWRVPGQHTAVYSAYANFSQEVTSYLVQIKIRHGKRVKRFSVALDSSDKQKIRHHLEQIRSLVESSSTPQDKKEAIFEKIAALALEIDRDRSRFESFADLASRLARLSGFLAREGAEPWVKLLKPIFEILGAAKESEENAPSLPAPQERKRLEPPRREQSQDDGDIPF